MDRRTRNHDPELHKLDDSLDGVVEHVGRHGDPAPDEIVRLFEQLDDEVIREDVVDALLVLDYLDDLNARRARQLARWRLGVILAGTRAGMTPTTLMAPLHQRHRQGVPEIVGRLRALLDPNIGIADARIARKKRKQASRKRPVPAAQRVNETAALVAFARGLLARRNLVPPVVHPPSELVGIIDPMNMNDLLDDIADRLPEGPYPPGPGLASALRVIVRKLTPAVGLDPELKAVLEHGAQSLPPDPQEDGGGDAG